jgi:hypothetical protein
MKQMIVMTAMMAMLGGAGAMAQTDTTSMPPIQGRKAPVSPPRTIEIPTVDNRVVEQKQAEVNFLTGGIGDDERSLIQAAKASYNVHITNIGAENAFVGESEIRISNSNDVELLRVNAGPLLYVQLPAGKYTIHATRGDETKNLPLTVGGKKKSVDVKIAWEAPATE